MLRTSRKTKLGARPFTLLHIFFPFHQEMAGKHKRYLVFNLRGRFRILFVYVRVCFSQSFLCCHFRRAHLFWNQLQSVAGDFSSTGLCAIKVHWNQNYIRIKGKFSQQRNPDHGFYCRPLLVFLRPGSCSI